VISITFQELSIEEHTTCRFDSVTLYDGANANSRKLGKYCKPDATKTTMTSTGKSVFVLFQTDYAGNIGRFSLSWKAIAAEGWAFLEQTASQLLR